eukprot:TRINITY_DN9460_c0_g3_i2.p1 TRINITY_DN9460_c0_g3~~TRINITY_DN9460_c0_g3_i2.p1  ORF type:complete len:230 (-),score=65.70 TRINITY_DN9460_c0_g3_i2:173-862(-)
MCIRDRCTVAEQIEFQSTILSRFDCIFLVKDTRDEAADRKIAEHVMNLHIGNICTSETEDEIPLVVLKKYITYARARCFPRLTEAAGLLLENFYVNDRKETSGDNKKCNLFTNPLDGPAGRGIPITVRQLEAIIRLSESLAKMELSGTVNEEHVNEAHRIFHISTMYAATSGFTVNMQPPEELKEIILKIENALEARLSIGEKMQRTKLQEEMCSRFGNERAVSYVTAW